MLCQKCQKNNANVKIVKNYNGNITEQYLCSECANKEDINFTGFKTDNIFNNLFNVFTPISSSELICDDCKTTYKEFKKTGKFGCASCYEKFERYLDPLFKNIHGSTLNNSKLPKRCGETLRLKRKEEDLKEQLRKAVSEENFEEAAKPRDEIKALNKEGQ